MGGNAEIVTRLVELWEADRLDEAEELFHPEIFWSEPPDTIDQNVVTGPDAVRASLAEWSGQFDALRVETRELRESGDRVLHDMLQYARAGGSTAEIAGELFMVWEFRDGRAVRMEMFNDRAMAEEAFQAS